MTAEVARATPWFRRTAKMLGVYASEAAEVVQALAAGNETVPSHLAEAVDWLREFVAAPGEARAA